MVIVSKNRIVVLTRFIVAALVSIAAARASAQTLTLAEEAELNRFCDEEEKKSGVVV